MNLSMLSGIIMFFVSIIYFIFTLLLPNASVGQYPMEPKIFPLALSILMFLFSIGLIIRDYMEIRKRNSTSQKQDKIQKDKYLKKILLISALAIVYALLFNRVGYIISTILFLEGVLFVFNGWSKWKINTLIAIVFSIVVYIIFAKLLNVYLPMIPFLEI
ncbi:MAG: tripartite tricarboxylate transporter TctB family protein [Spirochaetes bacterium]|nr:tripartite tricarboxylate transporter TctB family protein [Spirochaetota bacterium]